MSATNHRREIAGRLANIVRERGLSVNRLSQQLRDSGVESNRQSLQAYLDGERDPSGPWLHAVAAVLGVRPAWLLTGEGSRWAVTQPSTIAAENALVDTISAGAASGFASEATLSAISDYRDALLAEYKGRYRTRINALAATVAELFALEAR